MTQEQQQTLLNFQMAAQNGNQAPAPQAQLSAAQYRLLQQQMLAAASAGELNGDDPRANGSGDASGYYFSQVASNGQQGSRPLTSPKGTNRLG